MKRYLTGTAAGFAAGFFILHPLSLLFQGLVHPRFALEISALAWAYNFHHIPMALFFGTLGAAFGLMNVRNAECVSKEKARVCELESMLPICSYCKKIRDDGEDKWYEVESYFKLKTETDFTHGICPDCFNKVMEQIDYEDKVLTEEKTVPVRR